MLTRVRNRLDYWLRNYGDETPPYTLLAWRDILDRAWPAIAIFITDPHAAAARLRQQSPFEVVLTSRERSRIYSAFLTT